MPGVLPCRPFQNMPKLQLVKLINQFLKKRKKHEDRDFFIILLCFTPHAREKDIAKCYNITPTRVNQIKDEFLWFIAKRKGIKGVKYAE